MHHQTGGDNIDTTTRSIVFENNFGGVQCCDLPFPSPIAAEWMRNSYLLAQLL